MTAFGGKSVKGEVKEKRLDMRDEDRDRWFVSTVARASAVRARKRRKEDAAKQRINKITLGGRIMSAEPTRAVRGAGWCVGAFEGGSTSSSIAGTRPLGPWPIDAYEVGVWIGSPRSGRVPIRINLR